MAITAQYKTYYGIHLDHWTESWGDINYHKILVKEYLDDEIRSTASASSSASITFLYPELVKSSYVLNGKGQGHFKIYNKSTSSTVTITGYTVTVKKINNAGTETDIATHTETLASNNSVVSQDYMAIPFFLTFSKAEVNENEKIALKLNITGGSDLCFTFDNWQDTEDIKIELPFAPITGG